MKRYYWLAFSLVVLGIGLFVYARNQPLPPEPLLSGPSVGFGAGKRLPLSYWVNESARRMFQTRGIDTAGRLLVNAGPKIVPDLLRLIDQNEPPLIERALHRWLPAKLRARYSNQREAQAAAALAVRQIVEYYPERSELQRNIPAIAAVLRSKNPVARVEAAHTLGFYGTAASNAVPALVSLTADTSSEVRAAAVKSLGKIRKPTTASLKAVRTALLDKNNEVRIVATQALARLEWKRNEQ